MSESKSDLTPEAQFSALCNEYFALASRNNEKTLTVEDAVHLCQLIDPRTDNAAIVQDAKAHFLNGEGVGEASTRTIGADTIGSYFSRDGVTPNWAKLCESIRLEIQRAQNAKTRLNNNKLVLSVGDRAEEEDSDSEAVAGPVAIPSHGRRTSLANLDTGGRLQHLVLYKFKKDVTEAQVSQATRLVQDFMKIPGVVDVKFGRIHTNLYPNMVDRSGGHTHALLVVLTGAKALEVC